MLNNFGSEKKISLKKNFWPKIFLCDKHFGIKKMCYQKLFGTDKIAGLKIWGLKDVVFEDILGPINNFGCKKLLGPKKLWVKIFFGPQKILKIILGPKKHLGSEKFGV